LKEEAQVRFINNPFNNSFAIENLSFKLAALGWQTFQDLDGYANWLNAEKLDKIKSLIKPIRALKITSFNENKIQLIGVNIFENPTEDKIEWETEGMFLEMEKLRFDKIERHEN
jgi:methylmalonyl-CoA mutase N-terminal domain/subunit